MMFGMARSMTSITVHVACSLWGGGGGREGGRGGGGREGRREGGGGRDDKDTIPANTCAYIHTYLDLQCHVEQSNLLQEH